MRVSWRQAAVLVGCLVLAGIGSACAGATTVPAHPLVVVAAPLDQAAGPAPSGRLVFVVAGDLWEWREGAVRQLTDSERFEGPSWSPDGEWLAASLVGTNHSDVVLLSPDGDLQARLTDHRSRSRLQDSDWGRMPAWSPDGTRIAYGADVRTPDVALWTIGPDGRNARQLYIAPDTAGGVDHPTWSPDGREIALTVFRAGPSQVEVLNTVTGRTRRLTEAANGAYDPAWSPDGTWIAYVVRDGTRHDIWVSHPDGSGAARVTASGRNRMPAWSPDGAWLAFLSLRENGFDVQVLPIAAEGEIQPSDGRALVTGRVVEGPAGLTWGP
jgi:TolB protein